MRQLNRRRIEEPSTSVLLRLRGFAAGMVVDAEAPSGRWELPTTFRDKLRRWRGSYDDPRQTAMGVWFLRRFATFRLCSYDASRHAGAPACLYDVSRHAAPVPTTIRDVWVPLEGSHDDRRQKGGYSRPELTRNVVGTPQGRGNVANRRRNATQPLRNVAKRRGKPPSARQRREPPSEQRKASRDCREPS